MYTSTDDKKLQELQSGFVMIARNGKGQIVEIRDQFPNDDIGDRSWIRKGLWTNLMQASGYDVKFTIYRSQEIQH